MGDGKFISPFVSLLMFYLRTFTLFFICFLKNKDEALYHNKECFDSHHNTDLQR